MSDRATAAYTVEEVAAIREKREVRAYVCTKCGHCDSRCRFDGRIGPLCAGCGYMVSDINEESRRLAAMAADLLERETNLREVLEKIAGYTQHAGLCSAKNIRREETGCRTHKPNDCDCGLREALATLDGKKE